MDAQKVLLCKQWCKNNSVIHEDLTCFVSFSEIEECPGS
jgi:hypothetical protein